MNRININSFSCRDFGIIQLLFSIIILMCALTNEAPANIAKSLDQVMAGRLELAIRKYKVSENKFPQSWNELSELEITRNSVESIVKEMPGFERDFRFLASGKKVRIKSWDGGGSVIAMGTSKKNPGRYDSGNLDWRMLIVVDQEGNISLKTYKETDVESLFRNAGVQLSDYTGPDGKWEPEPANVKVAADPASTLNHASSTNQQEKLLSSKSAPPGSDDETITSRTWSFLVIIASFIALFILGFMGWMKLRKANSE
jgi:hypothetical protein